MYLGFWLSIEVGVGPKTEITEISAETETEISAEIDFGHINFSAEILNSKYTINQEIFNNFNFFKVFLGLEIMFLASLYHYKVAIRIENMNFSKMF